MLPCSLTPYGHEMLVRLSGWMSFGKRVELFAYFVGTIVSPSASQRYAEEAGATYEALQNEEVTQLELDMPLVPTGAEKMQMSTDGAMVPFLHGQ